MNNITATNNNEPNEISKETTLPSGMSNIDDINTETTNQMIKNGEACSYYYPIEITL